MTAQSKQGDYLKCGGFFALALELFPFFSQVCLGTITATSTERARRRSFNTITTQAEWLHGVYDGWGLEEADRQCHLYPASSPCSSERIGGEGARNENTPPNLLPQHRGRGSRCRRQPACASPYLSCGDTVQASKIIRAEPLQQEGLPAMLSLKNQRSKACLLFYGSP